MSKKQIVLASNNLGKIREINQLIGHVNYNLILQSKFNIPKIKEIGLTFIENAILKARNATYYSNLPAIADDSGIEVDALQGAPGIHSARYAGENASDEENLQKLLSAIATFPKKQRSARFQCVIVYMRHVKDPSPIICQGSWKGYILTSPKGVRGFGYDSIFCIPQYNCSVAELDPTIKNTHSHRGKALLSLLTLLNKE